MNPLSKAVLPLLLLAPLAALHAQQAQQAPRWVLPEVDAPRVQRVLFDSKAAGRQVSCHVFTPRDYETAKEQRFPVLYWLHGTGGGLPGIPRLSEFFDRAMQEGKIPPMLVVFPNGLAGSMWCDSKDGTAPIETLVIQELIPHIDTTYRTIAAREGRIIEGFSMGGYGAARLGFKHPQLFGAVSILAGGPLDLDFAGPRASANPDERERILQGVFGGDLDYYRAQHPITIAEQQADAVRGKVIVRMAVGSRDSSGPLNRAYSAHLQKLNLTHTFSIVPDASHDTLALLQGLGEANWEFYRSAFRPAAKPVKTSPNPATGKDATEEIPALSRPVPPRLIPDPNHTKDHACATRTCSGVASMTITPGGRLWAAWYVGTTPGAKIETCPNAYVVISTSGDGGKSWREVLALDPDGPGRLKAVDPRPWVDPKGRLWIICHITINGISHVYQNKKAWAITADDAEKETPSWSRPRHIADGVMINKPVVLANGEWLFAAHDRQSVETGLLKAVVSEDNGQTFKVRGQVEVSHDVHAIEPMAVERKDGSLWMLIRTGNAGDLDTPQGIAESFCTDRGVTWSVPKPSAIKHTASRFHISRLQSGNLLLVKHSAIDVDLATVGRKQRRELTAFISQDDGRTWSKGLIIDERVGCTYPDAQQAADGTIYLIWDFSRSKEQEILLTTFREEDVLTASDAATARVKADRKVVSKGGTP